MTAIAVPFGVSGTNKGLGVTANLDVIARQEILDVIMTANGERVMRPTYGADARRSLFEPLDNLMMHDVITRITGVLKDTVKFSTIINVSAKTASSGESTLEISVSYITSAYQAVQTVSAFLNGVLTEESLM
jgi:phage baseplate assembly protein W